MAFRSAPYSLMFCCSMQLGARTGDLDSSVNKRLELVQFLGTSSLCSEYLYPYWPYSPYQYLLLNYCRVCWSKVLLCGTSLPLWQGLTALVSVQGLVVFATINTLLQTTSAAQPGSVLTFPGFWATAAVLGLTVTIAWGGCGCVPI